MRPYAPALVALALTLPAHALLAQAPDREVIQVVERLFDGMRTKDTAAIRALFVPDARLVNVNARTGRRTLQAISVDQFLGAVAGSPARWDETIRDPEVRIDGDIATVWTYYDFHADTTFSHCGIDAFGMVRLEDGWKIAHLQDTRRRENCRARP